MEQPILLIALTVALITHMIVVTARERRYQKTIDRLTDKIMARDYSEYKRNSGKMVQVDDNARKPMSFYDDPGIATEEDVQ